MLISFSQHSACQALRERRRGKLPSLPAVSYIPSTNLSPPPPHLYPSTYSSPAPSPLYSALAPPQSHHISFRRCFPSLISSSSSSKVAGCEASSSRRQKAGRLYCKNLEPPYKHHLLLRRNSSHSPKMERTSLGSHPVNGRLGHACGGARARS